jgi:hypothetical protein
MRLRTLTICIFFFCLIQPAWSWDNPDRSAPHFQDVPADRVASITLESNRVVSINGDVIIYDLGRKTIFIRTDSFKAQKFAEEVRSGRKSASARVTLVPERKSPFNAEYKAK